MSIDVIQLQLIHVRHAFCMRLLANDHPEQVVCVYGATNPGESGQPGVRRCRIRPGERTFLMTGKSRVSR